MKPQVATLLKVKTEAENVLSFKFKYPGLKSQPGQFVMIWLPGIDQKPFSIAGDDGKTFTVAVFKIKTFTAALFNLKVGDKVGVAGPFGKPYTWKPRQYVIAVGGGYGSAPLANLIQQAQLDKCSCELLIGARTSKLLLYPKRFPKTFIATDDGSLGHHGYVTQVLERRLQALSSAQRCKTTVYVCGPEVMEYAAATIAQRYHVACQISLERYMKCGFGVCGQCCIDDTGERMCVEGPVLSGERALKLAEFGKYHRDKSGKIIHY
ncbi:MAG: hypothetical protein ACD_43C00098G0003 [uncultured bacterium]|nr:MAG: hypothetical protein ACD_43C00098G0003 [uncultured bacterium]